MQRDSRHLDTLAAAYAEAGMWKSALAAAGAAVEEAADRVAKGTYKEMQEWYKQEKTYIQWESE
ncbi:MAG: hypothetical protein PHQ23_00080 [Candidatus Wallbacteria bacterium]|nr:hypothetical protein [Candidatus Wallbacteria bacterium]